MTRDRAALSAALLSLLALTACAGGPSVGNLGRLEPPPAELPLESGSAADELLGGGGFTAESPDLDWGDGVLRPSGKDGFEHVDVPLFETPGGRHWGWITQGRVYDRIERTTLPDRSDAAVLVEGTRAFLVLDVNNAGWLQIRYGGPDDPYRGLAWTRADLTRGAGARFVRWSSALDGAAGLVYRNAGVAHNLRAKPSDAASVVERLQGDDFDMKALEIDGDWMRVRVSSPPACAGSVAHDLLLGGSETREQTGWIAWRDDARGPWVVSQAGERCQGGA